MAHLRACEVRQLLHNKFVVVMGDSIQRAVYKDLVLLLQKDCLLTSSQLKARGERSFEQDVLLEGGRRVRRHNGSHYREVRQFCSGHHLVRFYFLTRVYSQYVVNIVEELSQGEHSPDLVIMNSNIRDLPRYGRNFRRRYREHLESLFRLLDQVLPVSCLLVWNTAMPIAEAVSGSFQATEEELQGARLREDVMEANFYSSAAASRHGFDVLDLHFHFRHAVRHRHRDGVHWDQHAHRYLSQLLLAHVADAWGVTLPVLYPVGRCIRDDGPAAGSRGPRGGGHPSRDHRGDHRGHQRDEEASCRHPPRSTSSHAPRRHSRPSMPYPQTRPQLENDRPDAYMDSHPSRPSPQPRQCCSDSLARSVEYSGDADPRSGPEPRAGPSRRASTHRRNRGSPPYHPQNPGGTHRHRRRHADRQSREWQGSSSRNRN